jgi:diacylglycerol kinase (ATP)
MQRIGLIFNPTAGGRQGKAFIEHLRHNAPDMRIAPTLASGDGRKLAMQLVGEGCDTIVAAGGDGTVNEVVNGLATCAAEANTVKVRFGALPLGTQNVFAEELGMPRKLAESWKIIEQGRVRAVDLARVSCQRDGKSAQHFFVQLAGVGLDARAVQLVNLDVKRWVGPLAYVIAGLKAVAEPAPHLKIEADGAALEGSFALIGNGRYYGGRFVLFPKALNDDGKLDVCVFRGKRFLDCLRYLHGIARGVHTSYPDVKYVSAARLRVVSAQGAPLEADGELLGCTPAEFDLWPKALQVLGPVA